MKQNEKNPSIDWLRALGIVLVVYGHSLAGPVGFLLIIYAFHMPLFFFLSGFVLKPTKAALGFGEFAKETGRALLVPYVCFGVVGYLAWLLVLRKFGSFTGDNIASWKPITALFYGSSGPRGEEWLQPMVLWFFPCLFSAQIVTWSMLRLSPFLRVLGALTMIILAHVLRHLALPFEFESAMMAALFMLSGYILANSQLLLRFVAKIPPYLAPAIAGLAVFGAIGNSNVNLAKSNWGNNIVIYILVAAAFILSFFIVASRLPKISFIERVSASTLVIFPLHPLGLSVLTAVYVYGLRQPLSFRTQTAVGITATCILVAVLTLIAPLVTRVLNAISDRLFRRAKDDRVVHST